MKTKIPLFRGDTEPVQLDIIFQLLGSPPAPLLQRYQLLPQWAKMDFTKQYEPTTNVATTSSSASVATATKVVSKLRARYPTLELAGVSLLERLLDLDPQTRISAEEALKEPYFTAGPVPEPHELAPLSVEPVTEFLDQERLKREHEARRLAAEESQRAKEKEKEKEKEPHRERDRSYHLHHHHHGSGAGPSTTSSATAGTGAAGGRHHHHHHSGPPHSTTGGRGRAPVGESKYKIIKPVRPPATAAATATGGAMDVPAPSQDPPPPPLI
mmetsp:Transcript_27947/g.38484  ORF Transcript_27947/g.38484 Transcript_27947/m.38484 type:complete len:270 (+) Transcript_27947:772-1581(+)